MWSEHKGFIIGCIVICLICLGGGFGVSFYFSRQELEEDTPSRKAPSVNLPRNAIEVHDQVAIDDVLIDSVAVDAPSFIAIHSNTAGKPGDVIAVSALITQPTKNIVIVLPQKLDPGETYFVLLHKDDGDGVHTFPGRDTIVNNDQNKPLIASFTALAP